MRILHINCNYMTTVLHQTMIEHLNKTGTESVIFAPVSDASRAVIVPHSNVIVSECFDRKDRLCFEYKQKKILSALERAVSVPEFDCIHAYTLFTDGNSAMRLSQKYGIPYVVAVRSTDINAFFKYRPWLIPHGIRIMERAAAVFFLSERYLELTLNQYVPAKKRQAIREKCRVIPNGIDDFWLDHPPVSLPEHKLDRLKQKCVRLIVVGRINRNKNQLAAMHAAAHLNTQGWDAHLIAVGSVEDESVAAALRRNPLVTLIPAQQKEELLHSYRESDIFVLPSHQETFGLVYAEAMSQGLPVLYTRGQGFDRQFPDGVVGLPIDPASPEDIAQKIISLCCSYQQIASENPKLAQRFRWADIVQEYADLYQDIISQ